MEEQDIKEKENLELIARIIQQTQKRIEQNFGLPFIVCGYVTCIISLILWVIYYYGLSFDSRWNYLWIIVVIASLVSGNYTSRHKSNATKTYLDRVLGYIWAVLGCVAFMVGAIAFFANIQVFFLIPFLLSLGVILTGLIIEHRTVIVCGLTGTVLALICLLLNDTFQILLFGIIFLIMMVIPGYAMNHRARETN